MSEKVCEQVHDDNFSIYNGDSCELIKGIPDNSIHHSIHSPPFASLYTYSNSPRDMGNCKNDDEFFEQYKFLLSDLFRVMMPGRISAVHCMNLPTSKERDGYIGLRDFRGGLIRAFQAVGFIYHSEVTIWKDPVTAMQRTKALGLLHKQIKKNSCMSRQGIPDYLCMFRKPGDNPEPVTHTAETFPVAMWQRYASPVWATSKPDDYKGFVDYESPNAGNADKRGIRATKTMQSMAEEKDERHVCPLQLEVIERSIDLWSNPGDVVFSPFSGIGSEIYQAIKMGRRGLGFELKKAYFDQSLINLRRANAELGEKTLFAEQIEADEQLEEIQEEK